MTVPHAVRSGGNDDQVAPGKQSDVQVAPGKTEAQFTTGNRGVKPRRKMRVRGDKLSPRTKVESGMRPAQWNARSLSWWRSRVVPPSPSLYFVAPELLLHHCCPVLNTDVIKYVCTFLGRGKYRGDLFSGKSWEYQDYNCLSTTHVPKWRRTVLNGSHGEWTEGDDMLSKLVKGTKNRQNFKRPLLPRRGSGVDSGLAQMNRASGSTDIEMREFVLSPVHQKFGIGTPAPSSKLPPIVGATKPVNGGVGIEMEKIITGKTVGALGSNTTVKLAELRQKFVRRRAEDAADAGFNGPPAAPNGIPILSEPIRAATEPVGPVLGCENNPFRLCLLEIQKLRRPDENEIGFIGPTNYNYQEFLGPLNVGEVDYPTETSVPPLDVAGSVGPLHGPLYARFVLNENGSTRFCNREGVGHGWLGDWHMQRSHLDTANERYTPQVAEVCVPSDPHVRSGRVPTTLPMKRSTCCGFLWRIFSLPRRALACIVNPFGFDRGLLDCLLDPPVGPSSGFDLDPLPSVEVLGVSTDLSRMVGYRTTYVAEVLPDVENFLVATFAKSITIDTFCMARMRAVASDKMAEMYPGESFGDSVLVNTVARAAARLKLIVAHGVSHQGSTHERVQVKQW